MKEVLIIFAGMSLCGSAAYLGYLVLKSAAKKKLTSGWRYAFLRAVALLFILPVPLALAAAIPEKPQPAPEPAEVSSEEVVLPPVSEVVILPSADRIEPTSPEPAPKQVDWELICAAALSVWAVGAIAVIAVKAAVYAGFRKTLARSAVSVSSEEAELFERCRSELGVGRRVGLSRCSAAGTPMILGIFRPEVVLPVGEISPKSLEYVYLHELTHLRRGDLFSKAAVTVILALHWFNPLVWAFWREFIEQLELSCDELAVRDIDRSRRKEYGMAILEAVPVKRVGNVGLVFGTSGKKKLERRLSNMLDFKNMTKSQKIASASAAAAIIAAICVAVSFAMPKLKSGSERRTAELLEMSGAECSEFFAERGVDVGEDDGAKALMKQLAENPDILALPVSSSSAALEHLEAARAVREYIGLDTEPTRSADELTDYPGDDAPWGDRYLYVKKLLNGDLPSGEENAEVEMARNDAEKIAAEVAEIIGEAEAVRYRLENPAIEVGEAADGGVYLTFTADWISIREPEDDPMILGMLAAAEELTDPQEREYAEEIADGWIEEMKSWPKSENLPTYLLAKNNGGEWTYYYRYVINGVETPIELRQYAAENMTEDYDGRFAEGRAIIGEALNGGESDRGEIAEALGLTDYGAEALSSAKFIALGQDGITAALKKETADSLISALKEMDFKGARLETAPPVAFENVYVANGDWAIGFNSPYIAVAGSADEIFSGGKDYYKFDGGEKVFSLVREIAAQISDGAKDERGVVVTERYKKVQEILQEIERLKSEGQADVYGLGIFTPAGGFDYLAAVSVDSEAERYELLDLLERAGYDTALVRVKIGEDLLNGLSEKFGTGEADSDSVRDNLKEVYPAVEKWRETGEYGVNAAACIYNGEWDLYIITDSEKNVAPIGKALGKLGCKYLSNVRVGVGDADSEEFDAKDIEKYDYFSYFPDLSSPTKYIYASYYHEAAIGATSPSQLSSEIVEGFISALKSLDYSEQAPEWFKGPSGDMSVLEFNTSEGVYRVDIYPAFIGITEPGKETRWYRFSEMTEVHRLAEAVNEKIRAEDVPYKGLTDLLQDWKESGKYNINSYYGTRRETTVRCQTEEDCEKVSAALAAEGYDLEDFDIYPAVRVNIGMVPVSVGEDGLVCLQGSLRGFDKNSDGNYTITVINVPLDKPLLEEQLGTKIEMEPGKEYTLVLPPDFKVDGNSRWGSQVSDFEDIYGVVDIYGRLDTTGENPERFVEVEKIVFRRRVYDDEFADDVLD